MMNIFSFLQSVYSFLFLIIEPGQLELVLGHGVMAAEVDTLAVKGMPGVEKDE
jgi:hypothetical protein